MTLAFRALAPRFSRLAAVVALVSTAAVAGACSDDPLAPQFPEDVQFAASLGINLAEMTRLESGVYIQTLTPGTGIAVNEGTVGLRYTLYIPDGTQIDDNRDPEAPLFEVNLANSNSVIPGFYIGILGMQLGEERRIVIPSELGYGPRGQPNAGIPPQSVLIFEVELVEVTPPEVAP